MSPDPKPTADATAHADAHADGTADAIAATLQRAMQCQQAGRLDDADQHYRQVLAQAPRHADALHLLGVLQAQRRDFVQAQDLIWQAITVKPDEAMFHNNLANVCIERGLLAEAEPLYVRAIELDGGRLDALSNLGLLLARTGRTADAERLLLRAVELAPDNPDWRQNLANLYLKLGRETDALQQCHDGLVIAPRSRVLRALLVLAYGSFGHLDRAAQVLRAWVKAEPDDPYPRHHLAACTGEQVPERASDQYVASVFDGFARSFDAKLADLSYQAPALVAAAVASLAGLPTKALDLLDAGCGTGLCGPLLAPFAKKLVGVDLSEGMLRGAVERGDYDELFQGELVAFLEACPGGFDGVASADTLCYFGALAHFAAAAKAALRPGGWLVFTVEALQGAASESGYRLQGHGRYSHSQAYVSKSLLQAGLQDVATQAVVLRNEGGKPVDGWLVSARAPC